MSLAWKKAYKAAKPYIERGKAWGQSIVDPASGARYGETEWEFKHPRESIPFQRTLKRIRQERWESERKKVEGD